MIELLVVDTQQAHKVQSVRVITVKCESLLATKLGFEKPAAPQMAPGRANQRSDRAFAFDNRARFILRGGSRVLATIHGRISDVTPQPATCRCRNHIVLVFS
jgi:hypothetical protein